MKTERQHIMALKFLEMFALLLVRLGLHSLIRFIFSLLILTMEIGVFCLVITLPSFPVTMDIITNTTLCKESEPVLSALKISRSTYRAVLTAVAPSGS